MLVFVMIVVHSTTPAFTDACPPYPSDLLIDVHVAYTDTGSI